MKLVELLCRARLWLIDELENAALTALDVLCSRRKKAWKAWDAARTLADIEALVK